MDYTTNIKDLIDELRGALFDEEDITTITSEMKNAKIGTIKADSWEKIGDDEYIMYVL